MTLIQQTNGRKPWRARAVSDGQLDRRFEYNSGIRFSSYFIHALQQPICIQSICFTGIKNLMVPFVYHSSTAPNYWLFFDGRKLNSVCRDSKCLLMIIILCKTSFEPLNTFWTLTFTLLFFLLEKYQIQRTKNILQVNDQVSFLSVSHLLLFLQITLMSGGNLNLKSKSAASSIGQFQHSPTFTVVRCFTCWSCLALAFVDKHLSKRVKIDV